MKVKVIKETTVESKHFDFKVSFSGNKYELIIPDKNPDGSKTTHALVFWKNINGDSGSTWYSLESIEKNFKDGTWIVTNILD